MDTIRLSGLKFETVIGTYDWERKVQQAVILDLEIDLDTKSAAASDRLTDTLDYAGVVRRLDEVVSAARFHLLEALAEACARIVVTEFQAAGVRLSLHKPGAVRNAADVALRIERKRADYA